MKYSVGHSPIFASQRYLVHYVPLQGNIVDQVPLACEDGILHDALLAQRVVVVVLLFYVHGKHQVGTVS